MHAVRLPRMARLARALPLLLLALALTGCVRARGDQGATFDDPGDALAAALGPGGWLGPIDRVQLHDLEDAPESRVALYSARRTDGNGWFVGVADAKQERSGWFAHGRIGALSPPPLAGEVSCARMTVPAGGAEWLVLVGAYDPDRVVAVEAVADDGTTAPAALRDDVFTAMSRAPSAVSAIRALDSSGAPVAELPLSECIAP
jgi:hypothetical protein